MLNVLIADDHPIFRKGLMDILRSKLSECSIVDVSDGKEAIDVLQSKTFDIAILDVDMPNVDGLEVCKYIKSNGISTKVVIMTMYKDEEIFNSAMVNGANGFLLKDHSGVDMVDCIDHILLGKLYIGKGLEDRILKHSEYVSKQKRISEDLKSLTAAELKTLKLVEKNNTSRQIAEKLFVTQKTVENYRSRICKKLNIPAGNNALIRWVMDNKEMLKNL